MSEKKSFNSGKKSIAPPEFVWICGAVGSGNTFLFRCLTKDPNVYGINEDALGNTLDRFVQSGIDMGTCPHGLESYVDFMHGLRRDRRTLILKTPSNIHFHRKIRKYLPGSRFIVTLREPHAAIASGLSRHRADVEKVAEIWLKDTRLAREIADAKHVVNFDELVTSPESVFKTLNNHILPIDSGVLQYARKHARPRLASPNRWKTRVDNKTRREIELWVERLSLNRVFMESAPPPPSRTGGAKHSCRSLLGELGWIGTQGKKILRRLLGRQG